MLTVVYHACHPLRSCRHLLTPITPQTSRWLSCGQCQLLSQPIKIAINTIVAQYLLIWPIHVYSSDKAEAGQTSVFCCCYTSVESSTHCDLLHFECWTIQAASENVSVWVSIRRLLTFLDFWAILYATSVCRPLLFWFSCKWQYINNFKYPDFVIYFLLFIEYARSSINIHKIQKYKNTTKIKITN